MIINSMAVTTGKAEAQTGANSGLHPDFDANLSTCKKLINLRKKNNFNLKRLLN